MILISFNSLIEIVKEREREREDYFIHFVWIKVSNDGMSNSKALFMTSLCRPGGWIVVKCCFTSCDNFETRDKIL